MKRLSIITLVKWVPSTTEELLINKSGKSVKKEGMLFILNEFDNYALGEALRLKEENNGRLTAITLGPLECQEALVIALAKGADEAIHLICDHEYDAWATSEILARLISTLQYDVILTGLEATDTNEGQVSVFIAEKLGLPHVAAVTEVKIFNGKARVVRELGGGVSEEVETPLPAVFAVMSSRKPPGYASLSRILAARKMPIRCLELRDVGLSADKIKQKVCINKLFLPERKKTLQIITGETVEEKVETLFNILHQIGVVK